MGIFGILVKTKSVRQCLAVVVLGSRSILFSAHHVPGIVDPGLVTSSCFVYFKHAVNSPKIGSTNYQPLQTHSSAGNIFPKHIFVEFRPAGVPK